MTRGFRSSPSVTITVPLTHDDRYIDELGLFARGRRMEDGRFVAQQTVEPGKRGPYRKPLQPNMFAGGRFLWR
jgi:hypothetical protein